MTGLPFVFIPQEEIGTTVSGLEHAATQFLHVFKQGACRVVHIHGDKVLFSCFDLENGHILVLYSEKLDQSTFDTGEADRGVQEVSFDFLNSVIFPQSFDLTSLPSIYYF